MTMTRWKKGIASMLALLLITALVLSACTKSGNNEASGTNGNSPAATGDRGPYFIADRKITGRIFLENDGAGLPVDQINNEVAQKIKEMTGITLEFQSTNHPDGLEELTTALASGDLPDVIVNYLDHGGRPENSVILKASREGVFTDLAPYLKNTKVYSKYFEDEFLPRDSKENIMFRPEFDGKVYAVHLNIPGSDLTDEERVHGRSGMWVRQDIVQALGVDPSKIKTMDELYDLAKRIKEGDFKDNNGKPVTVIGSRFWGGSITSTLYRNWDFGNGTRFDVDTDGKVKHLAETEYITKQIEFVRKLLSEGLLDKEAFTMDNVRAEEAMANGSFAITTYANVMPDRFLKARYVPMDQMSNYKGEDAVYEKYKSGYMSWEIPSTTKNPEDIVKFADFLASREGKLLWKFGIEGKHYTLKDDKVVLTEEWKKQRSESPDRVKDIVPTLWGLLLGSTDNNDVRDFGESWQEEENPEMFGLSKELQMYGNPTFKYWDGYSALSYLSEVPDIEERLKPVLDSYPDIVVRAYFAGSMEKATDIVNDYRAQLKKAGVEKFEAYLQEQYDKDPSSVAFYIDALY